MRDFFEKVKMFLAVFNSHATRGGYQRWGYGSHTRADTSATGPVGTNDPRKDPRHVHGLAAGRREMEVGCQDGREAAPAEYALYCAWEKCMGRP